jgi:DNA-directed RNA polymerase specialized sigma24 family protein
MADRSGFDEFVATRSQVLLRTAYLLTGEHALAEDLLQTALAKCWFAWGRIEGPPEPYVRRVITTTYATWWRRKWKAERPTGELPEVVAEAGTSVEDRDALWRALATLPRPRSGSARAP